MKSWRVLPDTVAGILIVVALSVVFLVVKGKAHSHFIDFASGTVRSRR
jgi:hypothetical protein